MYISYLYIPRQVVIIISLLISYTIVKFEQVNRFFIMTQTVINRKSSYTSVS